MLSLNLPESVLSELLYAGDIVLMSDTSDVTHELHQVTHECVH